MFVMVWSIINMLTHISPNLLDLSELYPQNNISLYESNQIIHFLFSIMDSHIPQLIFCLGPFNKTRPGLSRNPCTPKFGTHEWEYCFCYKFDMVKSTPSPLKINMGYVIYQCCLYHKEYR